MSLLKDIAANIRDLLPNPLRAAAWRAGKFLAPLGINREPSLGFTLNYLKKWGFTPTHVIDVGAYHGEWTNFARAAYPRVKVLMLEAQECKRPILQSVCARHSGDVRFEIGPLGPEDGSEVSFAEMETGSSVFAEKSNRDRVVRKLVTKTLDTIVLAHPEFLTSQFLKLDVQGYELEVLRGAASVLSHCEFVFLEASLIPVNAGCPLMAEILGFMSERGFRIFDICSLMRRTDESLWQSDLLFIKEKSRWLPAAELNTSNWI